MSKMLTNRKITIPERGVMVYNKNMKYRRKSISFERELYTHYSLVHERVVWVSCLALFIFIGLRVSM